MLNIEIYGESRARKIGIRIFDFPKGLRVNLSLLQKFVDRRKSQDKIWSTPRRENDLIDIVSGVKMISDSEFETTGGLLEFSIKNEDILSDNISSNEMCRPSHADYVSYKKYGKIFPGGGAFSGRMMAPFSVLGGIAVQALAQHGIEINAYITQIGKEKAKTYYDENSFNFDDDQFRLIDKKEKPRLVAEIESAALQKDSIGGKIECVAFNVPLGLGGPIYQSFEASLARHLFAIPAVKSFECGIGSSFAKMRGSQANDQFCKIGENISTKTNYNGGIVGGITNGEPIVFSVAIKPVPSIAIEQDFYNAKTNTVEKFILKGRNDCCIVPRAVVLVESALAITILENMIAENEKNDI